jgi:DNA-binding MarR family transcriptional regulator
MARRGRSTSHLGEELREELLQLLVRIKPIKTDVRRVHELALSTSQFVALLLLRDAGAVSVSTIADHLRLSRGATSSLVERLVRRQMVRRTEDPANRRQKRVDLSAEGRRLIEHVDAMHETALDAALASLSPETLAKAQIHVRALLELLPADEKGAPADRSGKLQRLVGEALIQESPK